MPTDDKDGKPKQHPFGEPPPAKKSAPTIPKTSSSGHPSPAIPRASTGGHPSPAIPRTSTSGQPSPVAPAAAPAAPKDMTALQKKQMGSQFNDGTIERRRTNMLGASGIGAVPVGVLPAATNDELEELFDGSEPAPGMGTRDVWKALQAPVQSRENNRSEARLRQVLHQFAVASNPRYKEETPGQPRGHIYVWDVSRAMNCEIPHFLGPKELSLAQTGDWMRHEGPMRGWSRTDEEVAYSLACEGKLVVALARDPKAKGIAIVTPEEPGEDSKPLLAGAVFAIGYALHPKEILKTRLVDYFHHV